MITLLCYNTKNINMIDASAIDHCRKLYLYIAFSNLQITYEEKGVISKVLFEKYPHKPPGSDHLITSYNSSKTG